MAAVDATGQRFGRLTVVGRAANTKAGAARWRCVCDCGGESTPTGRALRNGTTSSCGCYNRELARRKAYVMGTTKAPKHNGSYSAIYRTWTSMLQRCYSPSAQQFKNYGARGITVCDRWRNDFAAFRSDVGEKPGPDYSLDRIDNDRGYEPGNVRWATWAQQNVNTRRTVMVDIGGQQRPLVHVIRERGLVYRTVQTRLRRGWSLERALA